MSALGHLRICDFTGQLAGAGATRFLATFGAEVIRIEDPTNQGKWDILRGSPPFINDERGIEAGSGFNNHNVEKLGITLNLRTDQGRELLRELVKVSDVVSENFASGVMARLGFHYDDLVKLREDIIYVSNCGFGHTGPYVDFKSWGPIVQAVSGLTFASGLPDEPPAGWGYSFMDHTGGYYMAIAILSALVHRMNTGEGQWVDMSCTEAGATLHGPALLDYEVNGRGLRRPGSPHSNRSESPSMAPHGIYPALGDDEWVAIACRDDADWLALAQVINEPWARDARWVELFGRLVSQDELDGHLATWISSQTRHAVHERLVEAGVPASVVARQPERMDHEPNAVDWGLFPIAEHRDWGAVRVDGNPVHLSETDWEITRAAPCLGEHNEQVYSGLLGLSASEVDDLRADGVI